MKHTVFALILGLCIPMSAASASGMFLPMWDRTEALAPAPLSTEAPWRSNGPIKLVAQKCYSTGCHSKPVNCSMFGPGFADAGPVNCGPATPYGRMCCR